MGRRSRRRSSGAAEEAAPSSYEDEEGNVLVLRGSLSAASRGKVAEALSAAPLSQDDAWKRAGELLFERLAVSWTIAGAPPIESQRELLGRYRMASSGERAWVLQALRTHCAEHFPDVQAP